MIEKLNSIGKNLIFDLTVAGVLCGLVILNLYRNSKEHLDFTLADKVSLVLYCILIVHLIFLILLIFKNFLNSNKKKGIYFIFHLIGLGTSLYFLAFFVIFSLFIGTSPYTDEWTLHDFKKTNTCLKFDNEKVKRTVENFNKGIFPSNIDPEFLHLLKEGYIDNLPKKVTKIECGCRSSDSSIVVFRIWGADQTTYELELVKNNGKYRYKRFFISNFYEYEQ